MNMTANAVPSQRVDKAIEVELLAGDDARRQLADAGFREAWQAIYEQCPWGTVFQSPAYVETWYEIYHDQFEPLLVVGHADDGTLAGLITAAHSPRSGRLTMAGDHQAEYQVWLADVSRGEGFIEKALNLLAARQGRVPFTMLYLPPGTPLEWLQRDAKLKQRCRLERHARPIVPVDDTPAFQAYLKERHKKWRRQTTRQRLDRLEAEGELRLVQFTTAEQLDSIYDTMVVDYDFKYAAAYGGMPFHDDPCKQPFYRALQQVPGSLHTTALMQGGSALAVHLGIGGKGTLHPLIMVYSARHGKVSPFTLYLIKLLEQLATESWHTFDLTPGADYWKTQFATAHEEVHVLSVFPHAAALRLDQMRERVKLLSKRVVERCLGARRSASLRFALSELRGKGPLRTVRQMRKGLARGIWSQAETKIYTTQGTSDEACGADFQCDRFADFLHFQPNDYADDRQEVFSSALRIVEREGHVYSRVDGDRLQAYGWWGVPSAGWSSDDALTALSQPERTVVCQTATARGVARGPLLKSLLARMVADALKTPGVEMACVFVPATDLELNRVVEGLGFAHESSYIRRSRLFRASAWQSAR
jgi:CelD/BcsL family acetyltransferase involved in cellulose biosynthesis